MVIFCSLRMGGARIASFSCSHTGMLQAGLIRKFEGAHFDFKPQDKEQSVALQV